MLVLSLAFSSSHLTFKKNIYSQYLKNKLVLFFYLNLTVKVTNVTDNSIILHLEEVLASQDVLAASGGHEDVALRHGVVHSGDLVPLHGSLESIDGVHLSHDDSAAETSERLSTALTNISISSNKCNLDKFIVH